MKHRRTAWAACVVAIATLGLSGILAEGCGGDDSSGGPTGSAGTAGSGGSGGSGGSATGGGGAGGSKAGSAGSAGTKGDSGPSDAPTDADYQAICRASGADSGNACLDKCICDECSKEAVACFSDPGCRNLVDCANRNGCSDTTCASMKCAGELREAGQTGLAEALAFSGCLTPKCGPVCAGDGGGSDAPASDAPKSDAPASDAPAADAPAADAPAQSDAPAPTEAGGD